MVDVNINPFEEHDKTHSHPDDTSENISFNPGGGAMGGRSTWEPDGNKKHYLEEGKLKEESSLILMLTVCRRSYLSIRTEPQMQPITITLDAKASSFTSKTWVSHSPMRMES